MRLKNKLNFRNKKLKKLSKINNLFKHIKKNIIFDELEINEEKYFLPINKLFKINEIVKNKLNLSLIYDSNFELFYLDYLDLYNVTKNRMTNDLKLKNVNDFTYDADLIAENILKAVYAIHNDLKYSLVHSLIFSYDLEYYKRLNKLETLNEILITSSQWIALSTQLKILPRIKKYSYIRFFKRGTFISNEELKISKKIFNKYILNIEL
jgi:hypothetical protein